MIAFSRAVTGLRTAEQNLYVTSNNLSNVETEGYHRQRLNQYSFQTTSRGNFAVGLGVDADSVRQTRLEFLERNYRQELASYGEYKYEDKVYTSLQSIIGDDGSTIQNTLEDMWESFNELSKEYTTTVAGTYLRENAVALVAEFDGINDQLTKMQDELDTEVINVVREINDYAEQIANLNDKITRSEADGSLACELRDSRDSLIASLSELIEVEAENVTDTCVNIRTANGYLVVRTHSNKLSTAKITPGSTFCSPIWEDNGQALELTSGELKGIIDMRGGNVIGNLEHSSNGAPKEKMDIVISIDTEMDYGTVEDMMKNLSNMMDMLDRQSVNYQLYLTNGTKINSDDLKNFAQYMYSESAQLQIDNYSNLNQGTATISGLQEYIENLYGKDTQLSVDIWNYVENAGANFSDFQAYVTANETDDDELLKLQEQFDKFIEEGGNTLTDFIEYMSSIDDKDTVASIEEHLENYVDGAVAFDADDIKSYIDTKYTTTVIPAMITENSNSVFKNITRTTLIDFRDDSNKYLMVFTDDKVNNSVTGEEVAAKLNEIDMDLIAVTNEKSKSSWSELVEKTGGTVLELEELSSEETAEEAGLAFTRTLNSRLICEEEDNGIAFFRSGLNSLLNGLVREINGILRQGANGYGNRHGEVMKDADGNVIYDEGGEPKLYNLDLFIKIDEKLPLQMGNIKINPVYDDVMNMPLSLTGNTGDFQIGNMLVDLVSTDVFSDKDSYSTFDEYYANFILDFGQAANRALTGCDIQETVLTTAKDRISQVSGVSMDEELSNMVKFQYSYTAASKMIRVVDEMLETIISM